MMVDEREGACGGVNPCGSIVPISISDKAMLVEEMCRPIPPTIPVKHNSVRKERGRLTWIMAAIALPLVAVCLLITLFIMSEPYEPIRKIGRLRSTQPARKNIFIIDINQLNYPTPAKLATLETILKNNRNSELYQITINRYIDQPRNVTGFDKLKKKYSNFHFLFQSIPSYFRGSIFDGSTASESSKLLLFKAQLLILWRYGGIVLSPDWTTLKSIDKSFIKSDGTLLVGGYNGQLGIMSVSNTCNARLFDIMKEVKKIGLSKHLEMDVIDRIMVKSPKGCKRLGFPELCNNNTKSEQCLLMKGDQYFLRSTIKPVVIKKIISPPKINDPDSVSQNDAPTFFRRFVFFS